MSISPSRDRIRVLAVAFAAGAALLCASLANFLHSNEYPLLRPEVVAIVAALLALSAGMAFIYQALPRPGRPFLEGFLAALFIDLNTDSMLLAGAVGGAIVLFGWWRRTSALGPMAVLGSIVLLTTLLGLGGNPHWIKVRKDTAANRPNAAAGASPAIVHLILDEHIGLEGLPDDAEGQRLRDQLRSFYLANGFAVYGGAYSHLNQTVNAIPEILDYGALTERKVSQRGGRAGRTKHLQSLVDQGYRLTIFQSDYVDYCSGASWSECVTYDSSSLRPTLVVPMGVSHRAELIAAKFVRLSDIFGAAASAWNYVQARVLRKIGLSAPRYDENAGQSSAVGTFEALDELTRRIRSLRPGDAIFAHLLLPHDPSVVDDECGYLPWARWQGHYFHSTFGGRRSGYDQQVRCTTLKVGSMLRALGQSAAGRNAVVIVHGDHGSRLARVTPHAGSNARITDADLIDSFSTLFAVRAPGVKADYQRERLPVPALLRDFAASGFRTAPHPTPPRVATVDFVDSDLKVVRTVPLPPRWVGVTSKSGAAHRGESATPASKNTPNVTKQ